MKAILNNIYKRQGMGILKKSSNTLKIYILPMRLNVSFDHNPDGSCQQCKIASLMGTAIPIGNELISFFVKPA